MTIQKGKYCRTCRQKTLHAKEPMIGNSMGCLLTILTAGIFIPFWLLAGFLDAFRPMRCQRCGGGRLG